MKSVGAIKHKLNQVRFRHLKKRLDAELRPASNNCQYNIMLPQYPGTPSKGSPVEEVAVGVCVFGVRESDLSWPIGYCDDRIDEGARARTCEKFCPRRTKEEIKEEFQKRLDLMTLPEVACQYPDMAALIWVLDADDIGVPEDLLPEAATPMSDVLPKEVLDLVAESLPTAISEAPPLVQHELTSESSKPKKPWYARLLGAL